MTKKETEHKLQEELQSETRQINIIERPTGGEKKSREQKRAEAEERNEKYQLRKELDIRLSELEGKIEELEIKKEDLEKRLSDPATFKNGSQIQKIQVELAETGKILQTLYQEWEEVGGRIEAINNRNYSAHKTHER